MADVATLIELLAIGAGVLAGLVVAGAAWFLVRLSKSRSAK